MTIDRQCGSSQQAVHFAAQAVMSGTADLIVAGGVQNMSAIPISSAMMVGQQFGFDTPFAGSVGWAKRYGDQEVSQFRARRHDRREVGHQPRGHGAVRAREPPAGAGRDRRGPLRPARSCPVGDLTTDEGPRAGHDAGEDGRAQDAARGRPDHRGACRRRSPTRASAVLIASEDAVAPHRADPARPHPPHLGARRRPGVHAHRPDPGHPATRSSKAGHDARRHRPGRDQRGVRVGRAGLGEGASAPTWPR